MPVFKDLRAAGVLVYSLAIFGCAGSLALADAVPSTGGSSAEEQPGSADGALKDLSSSDGEVQFPVDYFDGLRAMSAGHKEIAYTLWLRAASFGDPKAMNELAKGYATGDALPKEPVLAYFYSLLASKLGDKDADAVGKAVGPKLTAAQIADIVKAVAAWQPTKLSVVTAAPQTLPADIFDAATTGNIVEAQAALTNGADVQGTDARRGWTPLEYAVLSGNRDMVGALLKAGAQANFLSQDGYTPLHLAAYGGDTEIVQELLDAGAHPMAVDPHGKTATDIARKRKFGDLAALLQQKQSAEILSAQAKLNQLGYLVGTPDGTMNAATSSQLAIFAHSISSPDLMPTPLVVSALFTLDEVRMWGWRLILTKSDGSSYESYNAETAAESADDVRTKVTTFCHQQGGATCKIDFVVPLGACFAVAKTSANVEGWSKIFASKERAESDALAQCKLNNGGNACPIFFSACVQ